MKMSRNPKLFEVKVEGPKKDEKRGPSHNQRMKKSVDLLDLKI